LGEERSLLLELPKRVTIVTGAARGIEFTIAERLSRAGARVVVADVVEEGAAELRLCRGSAGYS
jgi:NAD(P)-dependent dehydrogenase (short-subunit alcohol dehydrogenase family)